MNVEKDEARNASSIESDNILCCAETGRVIAVFYNDYDLDAILSCLKQRDELLAALKDARDSIAGWGEYVPVYFQEKHGLVKELYDLDEFITKAEG